MVEVVGIAMLDRVLGAVAASASVAKIVLLIEDSVNMAELPGAQNLIANGNCQRMASDTTPARSVLAAFDKFSDDLPILVLTGDHPLLTPAIIDHFCRNAGPDCDVGVGLASAQLVFDAYPNAVRTLLAFQDGPFCGCNLFALNSREAQRVVTFWTQVESARKHPWRLMRKLGIGPLLRYWLGALSLTDAMHHASAKLGLTVKAVPMPFAEAAIDVDKPADLQLANEIIRARG